MAQLETYTEYCREFIKLHIEDRIGQELYACDLASTLTEGPNVDGSCTYNAWKAKQYLAEWWDDCAEYFHYEKENFGENLHNPFEEPEAFMTCMLIAGVESLIGQVDALSEVWNEGIEITRELADAIVKEIEDKEVNL